MTSGKIRVLLDLSMAARGYCGIAQDVRLLYKILATCPDVEVTGLLYSSRKFGVPHRFLSRRAPLAKRLENQARALWALGGDVARPEFLPWRLCRKAHAMADALFATRARVDPLETEFFWQVVWRLFFQQTLAPDDVTLVQNGKFLLSNLSDGMVYARTLLNRRPIKLDTRGYDFLIVQGPRPFRLAPTTRQIVRYHDMIQVMHPDTMANPLVIKGHRRGLWQCVDRRSFFACDTEPTRDLLTRVYPEIDKQSAAIPCMVSQVYRPDISPGLVRSIIDTRRSSRTSRLGFKPLEVCPPYLICVSTLEPRKNFIGLVQAFNVVRHRPSVQKRYPELTLVIVGSPGWKYAPILAAMRGPVKCGDLIHLESVTSDELRVLYSHAEALVFPSHAEGFGLPPLEAMQCDVPAIVSDLPEHRWVLGDAALYCNSYDVTSIADAIERLVASPESVSLRSELIARGRERVSRYSHECCSRQWVELLHRLKHGQTGGRLAPSTQQLKSAA